MMELGIFSRTYETGNLEETFQKMTDHGIFHTQFNLSNAGLPTLPETICEEDLDRILKLTEKYHITIDAVSGTFNMIDPDEAAREQGCTQFETQCHIARELHIPIVSLCTGSKNPESKWKWHEDNLKQSSWDDLMRTTDRLLRYAEDRDIILGVETEASNIINTPERARKYLEQMGSPHLKIIMDGANLFQPKHIFQFKQKHDLQFRQTLTDSKDTNLSEDIRTILDDAFKILGKDIVLAHAKDFSLDDEIRFVAAGQGILDFPYYVQLLKKYGYHGPLIMHGLSEQQVPESFKLLTTILKENF